jgi:hypothetical protein
LKIFDLFGVTVTASAGLFLAAMAFSPGAAAAPLSTGGGPTCVNQVAGLAAPGPVVLPGPPVGAGGAPVPAGAPVGAGAPAAAGAPAGAPVAAGAPAGAPVAPAAAPVLPRAGSGKGVPTNPDPALTAGPVVLPGPAPVPTSLSPAPVAGPTLVTAIAPLIPCCNP